MKQTKKTNKQNLNDGQSQNRKFKFCCLLSFLDAFVTLYSKCCCIKTKKTKFSNSNISNIIRDIKKHITQNML